MTAPGGGPHWRVLLHAADRTGPPMLARALLREVRARRPDVSLDVVCFRGGEMVEELASIAPATVLLEDHEAWDHGAPVPARVAALHQATETLPAADAVLLVSVAAGQCLPYLARQDRPVVTWVVEQGADLHWLDAPVDVASRTDVWLAGSTTTRDELVDRLGPGPDVTVCLEFVEEPAPVPAEVAAARRRELVGRDDGLLVVGAGIGTWRKAPDLFLEVAAAAARRESPDHFVWVGGTTDELHPLVAAERDRLRLDRLQLVPAVPDLGPTLSAADVLLHPARLDAFPLVCLHAVLAGTPVVAFSGAGGVPEMLGDGFVGAPYPDVDGLRRAVDELRDPGRRQEVVARQRAAVVDRCTARVAAPTVMAALDRATRTDPQGARA